MNVRVVDAVCAPTVAIVTVFALMSAAGAGCTETPTTINWVFSGQALLLAICSLAVIVWRWGKTSRGYRYVYQISGLLAISTLAVIGIYVASRLG